MLKIIFSFGFRGSLPLTLLLAVWGPIFSQKKAHIEITSIPSPFKDFELDSPISMVNHPEGILVLDYNEKKAFCFSPSGKLLFEFGGKGEGPGELRRPLCVEVGENSIFIYDLGNRFLSEFDLKGNFRKRTKLAKPCVKFFHRNGRLIYVYYHHQGQPDLIIKDHDDRVIKEISLKSADQKTYYSTAAVDRKGFIYAAPLNKYIIEVYDPDGKFVRKIGRDHEAMPFLYFSPGRMEITTVPVSAITFYKDYLLVLHGGHQVNYETLSRRKLDDKYLMRVDVFNRNGTFLDYFWNGSLPSKMNDVHNQPIFWVDRQKRLWIQDPGDFRLLHTFTISE